MKKLVITGALFVVLSSFTSFQAFANEEPGLMDALNTIKAAEAAINKAAKADGAWRDSSSKTLKQAKSAANKGGFKLAIKLANKAKFEGEMGYQQAMGQKNAGPWAF